VAPSPAAPYARAPHQRQRFRVNQSRTSLEDLLDRTARGDRKAFAALYTAASAKLCGVILRIVRDRTVADDVLQEAFVRIWQRADQYDAGIARAMTWMASVARNAAIDEIRRRRPAAANVEIEEVADLFAYDPATATDELRALAECLGRLEPKQRDCVLLAYHEGYSREELSARFDSPVGTIKVWLHRATAALRTCLEQAS
jgi:RNA polymerase sigma-70 factor (ECF subfamily)